MCILWNFEILKRNNNKLLIFVRIKKLNRNLHHLLDIIISTLLLSFCLFLRVAYIVCTSVSSKSLDRLWSQLITLKRNRRCNNFSRNNKV